MKPSTWVWLVIVSLTFFRLNTGFKPLKSQAELQLGDREEAQLVKSCMETREAQQFFMGKYGAVGRRIMENQGKRQAPVGIIKDFGTIGRKKLRLDGLAAKTNDFLDPDIIIEPGPNRELPKSHATVLLRLY